MPQSPKSVCYCGRRRPCSFHRNEHDRFRPNAHQRGYGSANWRWLRTIILARDPICVACKRAHATDIDHVIPKREGGPDSLDNLQSLCKSCHSKKTFRERKKT